MGFLSKVFGTEKPDDSQKFATLRDDGIRALQIGEAGYAERCFQAALALQSDLQLTGLLAEALLRQRKNEEALPLLQQLTQESCPADNPNAFLLLAQVQGELGMYEEEHQTALRILEAKGDDVRALYFDAEASYEQGDNLQAIVRLTQALAIHEDFAAARLLRCRTLLRMGQATEALEDIQPLTEAAPENEELLMLRADTLAALGRIKEAIADYETVRSLNPFDRETVLRLGTLYEADAARDKALALYDEAIALQPDFAEAYKARGGVKHALKDEAGATEDLKRALELMPAKDALPDGEYTNIENSMNQRYRNMNPYGF